MRQPRPGETGSRRDLPNRVTPFGVCEADPARGTLMGNRGCLMNAHGELARRWQLERWITCVLEFKGRRRHPLMAPGQYTELSSSTRRRPAQWGTGPATNAGAPTPTRSARRGSRRIA